MWGRVLPICICMRFLMCEVLSLWGSPGSSEMISFISWLVVYIWGARKSVGILVVSMKTFTLSRCFKKKKNVSFFHLPLCLILLETLISLKDRYLPSQLLRWRRAFENLTSFHSLYIILFPVLYFLSHHLLRCLKLLSLSQVPGIVLVCSLLALPL